MNAALKTRLQAQLAEADAAITAIQKGGQSNSFGNSGSSSAVQLGDLATWQRERDRLQTQLYGTGSIRARQVIGG